MNRLSSRFGTAVLVVLAAAASPVRADFLNWSFTTNVTASPTNSASVPGISVGANDPNGGATVSLTNFNTPPASPVPSNAVLAYVASTSVTSPVTFGPGANSPSTYNLVLTITDNSAHDSKTLNFTGSLAGQLTATSSSVVNHLTPVTSNSLTMDGHTYTVTIPDVTLQAPNTPNGQGYILANFNVTDATNNPPPPPPNNGGGGGNVNGVPEPASLVLGSLGFSCFGISCWWKRNRRQPQQSAAVA